MADGDATHTLGEALRKMHRASEAFGAARKAHDDADARAKHLWEVWVGTEGRGEVDEYQRALAATSAARDKENKAFEALAEAMRELADAFTRYAAEVLAAVRR